MKRKTAAGPDPLEKTEKKARKFNKEAVDAPGFCTNPDLALPATMVEAVTKSATTADGIAHKVVTEKDLSGPGRSKKQIHLLMNNGNDDDHKDTADTKKMIVFYYTGKRFVKKDREHTIAFVNAAREARPEYADAQAFVLLAASSGICKRNALPDLCDAGFVVQRV